jgi:predicted DNA-binding ribbon-helix-helix protein
MKSLVMKRSIVIAGHKTSISLEHDFWVGLKEIARSRGMTLSEMAAFIDTERQTGNLSSAVRLFVLNHFRNRVAPATDAPRRVPGDTSVLLLHPGA